MYYLTVLDHTRGRIYQYLLGEIIKPLELKNWKTKDFEEFLVEQDFELRYIDWMSHADNTLTVMNDAKKDIFN